MRDRTKPIKPWPPYHWQEIIPELLTDSSPFRFTFACGLESDGLVFISAHLWYRFFQLRCKVPNKSHRSKYWYWKIKSDKLKNK